MFSPTPEEEASIPTLESLLFTGRALMRKPENVKSRLREQQDESAARSLAAAQRAMERFQWRPRASIALVDNCHCRACGSTIQRFAGFGVTMFRHSDQSERLVMTPALDPAFPRETHFTESVTAVCIECVESHGFSLEKDLNG